jgi:hypothetical protein
MKREKVSEIISRIDEKYINEAAEFALAVKNESISQSFGHVKRSEKPPRRLRWGAIAACLALIVMIGSTAFAVAAEAAEYNNAVAFFEENGLSTVGLSRSEVKNVYRDITQKKFSYDKTAEVLRHSVPGREISQREPAPEEIEALWEWMNSISEKGICFRIDWQCAYDEAQGCEVHDKSILECYEDGELLWSAEFEGVWIDDYAHTGEGTVLWGHNEITASYDTVYSWIALVDEEGSIAWQRRLTHGFKNEYVVSVLPNGDGTWAVISRGDLQYICLSCYDAAGKELSFHKTEMGNYGIRNAARLGDGYIIQLWNRFSGDTALLYKMDREGNLTDSFSYEEDDCDYYITDMVEFEGQVYLSAYAVPKQQDPGGRDEIANILAYIFSEGGWEIAGEELTPIVRDNYTAMLLICDAEEGTPKNFYSAKGSLGGKLSVNTSGQLEWEVESITSTFFSPATSSFSIGGNCAVFRYTFDAEGNLAGHTDTGSIVPYRR